MLELLTIREVARELRVDDSTVRRWIKLGVLEAIPLPHCGRRQVHRIHRETLNALLAPPHQGQVDVSVALLSPLESLSS